MTEHSLEFLDWPDIGRILFHPRLEYPGGSLMSGAVSLRIPVAGDLAVGGKIYMAGLEAPVILYFHGNGEIASDYDSIAPYYTSRGLTLFVVDYRGYGSSDGSPTATSLLKDAVALYNQAGYLLTQRGFSYPGLFVMGRSLGSAAAIEVAYRAGADIAGLIIESGFAYTLDLLHRLSDTRLPPADEAHDGFGNLDKISRVTIPCLFIHGQRDDIIPMTDGLALRDACGAGRKQMVIIPGAGHNNLLASGLMTYFDAIRRFVFAITPLEGPEPFP
ncbi:MAG: alpha/beta hydrolase [Rhodospirillaceae bacterium]|nr:MAG: alpha/beta hydrolase [Rhodospirillaceae bacterium]